MPLISDRLILKKQSKSLLKREQNELKMNKLTLLSPAGSMEAVVAAVSNGADAIYLGSKLFNARRLAGNFTQEELQKAVQYAHLHGVKVYLTLNTLVKNQEIGAFLNQVAIAEQLGINALILQDLTFARVIKEEFPQLEIHASTQATIMNSLSVGYWQKEVDQFVLARELTKQEVRTIFDRTHAKLEVFVHGHLCISYSGQCLISSLIGKRSGNRGMCASSCRKQYNGENYLLSAKDLCMIENIKDVIESGAATVKIEGRMKPAEYVATTTRAYREQIDALTSREKNEKSETINVSEEKVKNPHHSSAVGHSLENSNRGFLLPEMGHQYRSKAAGYKTHFSGINELKMAFNRNFTPGYFNDEAKIVDQTYSAKRGVYLGTVRQGLLRLEEDLELHDGVGIIERGKRVGDYVRRIFVNGDALERGSKGDQVKLLVNGFNNGAKVYLMTKNKGNDILSRKKRISLALEVFVQEGKNVEVSVSAGGKELKISLPTIATRPEKHPLTEDLLRREFEKYQSEMFDITQISINTDNSFVAKSALTLFRKELDQKVLNLLCPINLEKRTVAAPIFSVAKATQKRIHVRVYSLKGVEEAVQTGADIVYYDAFAHDLEEAMKIAGKKIWLHTPMVMVDHDFERLKSIIIKTKPAGILANNVGVLGMELTIPIVLGYQMNIFNDNQLQYYGYPAVASIELNLKELQAFQNKEKIIFYAHGYPAVMTFKEEFDATSLTDKKDYTFRLRKTNTGATEMLYSKAIGTLQHTPEVLKAGITQLFLDVEKDVFGVVSLYKRLLAGEAVSVAAFKHGVTVGNLEKGVM